MPSGQPAGCRRYCLKFTVWDELGLARSKLISASILDWRGPIAQRLEQQTHNLLVPGSNPGGPTSKTSRH